MSESQGATAEELQAAMRLAPATVAVITAESDGDINGLTATSFCSVSMEPPSILVCVNRDSRTHGLISASQRFCVNLLGAGQQGIANAFASTKPGEEKLKQADTSIIKIDEMPVLEEASAN
ncbi:MAG: flavin reductase family protein, partial [Candidatus Hydrogenedentota bacterium]